MQWIYYGYYGLKYFYLVKYGFTIYSYTRYWFSSNDPPVKEPIEMEFIILD